MRSRNIITVTEWLHFQLSCLALRVERNQILLKEEIHNGSEEESRKEKEEEISLSGAKSPYSREIVVTGVRSEHPFLFLAIIS